MAEKKVKGGHKLPGQEAEVVEAVLRQAQDSGELDKVLQEIIDSRDSGTPIPLWDDAGFDQVPCDDQRLRILGWPYKEPMRVLTEYEFQLAKMCVNEFLQSHNEIRTPTPEEELAAEGGVQFFVGVRSC